MIFNKKNPKSKMNYVLNRGPITDKPLSVNLDDNLNTIKELTGNSPDVNIRTIENGIFKNTRLALIYIEGLIEIEIINNVILRSLMSNNTVPNSSDVLVQMKNLIPAAGKIKDVKNMDNLLDNLYSGYTIILVNGVAQAISINTVGGERREIKEPTTDRGIRSPKEGFNEDLRTNIALVRRKIKSQETFIWNL